MSLRIVFSTSKKKSRFFADAIVWWDKKRYDALLPISHVSGSWLSKGWERGFYYQASGLATNFMGTVMFNKLHEIIEVYEIDVPYEVDKKIGQSCVDREGKPYAMKQTVGIAISAVIWLITKKEVGNLFADGDAEVNCLEEWGRIIEMHTDYRFPGALDKATPWQFREWIKSLPIAKEVSNGT